VAGSLALPAPPVSLPVGGVAIAAHYVDIDEEAPEPEPELAPPAGTSGVPVEVPLSRGGSARFGSGLLGGLLGSKPTSEELTSPAEPTPDPSRLPETVAGDTGGSLPTSRCRRSPLPTRRDSGIRKKKHHSCPYVTVGCAVPLRREPLPSGAQGRAVARHLRPHGLIGGRGCRDGRGRCAAGAHRVISGCHPSERELKPGRAYGLSVSEF
jgi:hypothetical protein